MRKLGDNPIPKYPSLHRDRAELTREAIVRHFTAHPSAAPAVIGMRNNSSYNPAHKMNMKLKFLETACPMHMPDAAPHLPVVRRAPPPLARAGSTRGDAAAAGVDAPFTATPATVVSDANDTAMWRARFEDERVRGAALRAEVAAGEAAAGGGGTGPRSQAAGHKRHECVIPTLSDFEAERTRALDRTAYEHNLRQTYGDDWKRFTAQQRIDVPTPAARQGAGEARLLIDRVQQMKVIQKRTYVHMPSNGPF